jgi:hypothetical protein
MVRQVILRLMGGKLSVKSVKRDQITADEIKAVLSVPTFAAQAKASLTSYVAGLKSEVSDATIESRKANAELAQKWIDAGMHETYLVALQIICNLGGQVSFTTDKGTISMPLNRALGVAFGRSITASELRRSDSKGVTKA